MIVRPAFNAHSRLLFALILFFGAIYPVSAQEPLWLAVAQVDPCVVTIHGASGSTGSGFIISPHGYVLTNCHVVGNTPKVTVCLQQGKEFSAVVLESNKQADLALVKLPVINLPCVRIGNSKDLKPGDTVVAIGSPMGLDHSVSKGIISAAKRVEKGRSYLQVDAALNPGNSGGPLFNASGEVVGINTSIVKNATGLGFAIPIESSFPLLQKHGIALNIVMNNPEAMQKADNSPRRNIHPASSIRGGAYEIGIILFICVAAAISIFCLRRRKRRPVREQSAAGVPENLDDIDITLH